MKTFFGFIAWLLACYMVLDIIAFCLWGASGQIPPDGFYIGAIMHAITRVVMHFFGYSY